MCCFVAVVPTYPILTQCCSRVTVLRGVCEVHYVWTEQHLLHGFAHYFPLNACLCLFSDLVSLVTDGLVSCLCVGQGDVAVVPIIVKSNDDLRQEQFVSQLLKQIKKSFQRDRVPVWLASYGNVVACERSCCVSCVCV